MQVIDIVLYSALPILLLLSAFFSGSETVLFSLTGSQRARIKSTMPKTDDLIAKCMADKAVLFSTLLVGNTFVNYAIAAIGYRMLRQACGFDAGWVSVMVMTLLLLVFGEITPKRMALKYAEKLAPACVWALCVWRFILLPFNSVLRFSSKAFAPALERERRALSDDELVTVMQAAAEHGEISQADVDMVEGVLRLSELCANDEMTPRVDVEGYDLDRDEEFRQNVIASTKHRYLPVFRRTLDQIEGVIEVASGKVEDALFVPETVSLDDLLVTFAKSKKKLAVVSDEYGGTAGIISVNDIIELVLGQSVLGASAQKDEIVRKSPNTWEIIGGASLDEVNRELDVELEAEDADRLAGWVQFHAERIPHVGQQIEADGCRATVLKRRHRRVTLVRLEVLSRECENDDNELIAETDEAVERTEEDDE